MSSIYRYVVFALGKQPTVKEVDQLRKWSKASKQPFAVGINNENGALTLVFDAQAFETACSAQGQFTKLISCWQVRGCEVRERLPFIKQPTALRPVPGDLLHENVESRSEPLLKRKQLAAQEALGRAGLKLHQSLQQQAWLTRMAKFVPYTLMTLIGLLTIIAGIYVGQQLMHNQVERRQQTIQRVGSNAMEETLARQSTNEEHAKE